MGDLGHAWERKAKMVAKVLGFGYYFDPYRLNKFNPNGTVMIEAMKDGLNDAELSIDDIDYICANANSTPLADRIETKSIKGVFGQRSKNSPESSIKSMVGETYSAGGAFAAAACVGSLTESFIPPTINYKEPDPECDLDYVPNQSRKANVKKILINSFGPSGNHACMVLGKYDS